MLRPYHESRIKEALGYLPTGDILVVIMYDSEGEALYAQAYRGSQVRGAKDFEYARVVAEGMSGKTVADVRAYVISDGLSELQKQKNREWIDRMCESLSPCPPTWTVAYSL